MKPAILGLLLLLPQDDAAAPHGWRDVQRLVEKGETSRAALEKAAGGTDADVAFFAAAALGELDCRRAGDFPSVPRTGAARGDASTVLAALFKSAGLDAILDDVPRKPLAIPDDLTFAEALQAASDALEVDFSQAENGAWKAGRSAGPRPRFVSGRVRATVTAVSNGTYWRPGLPPRCLYWIRAQLDGFGRFKQPPMYADLRVLEAVDEHGRDLRSKRDWFEETVDRREEKDKERRAGLRVDLEAPDLKSTKVARLRLAVDFAFRKKDGTITFENPDGATNLKKKVGDVEATLVRAGKNDKGFEVELQLKAPGIGSRISKDEDDFLGSPVAHLLDADGKGWHSHAGNIGTDGGTYFFKQSYTNPGALGPPATFSVSLITEVENRSVYLEFRDVSLR